MVAVRISSIYHLCPGHRHHLQLCSLMLFSEEKNMLHIIIANAYVYIYFVMREKLISKVSTLPKQVYFLPDKADNWNIKRTKEKERYALPIKVMSSTYY